MRAYHCPGGNAQAVADQLNREFGNVPGVRIAADVRTSQVLVMAPAGVQAQIAARLGAVAPAADPPTAEPREVRLARITPETLEARLARVLGDRLQPAASPRPGVAQYRLVIDGQQVGQIFVDRPNRRVVCEGPERVVRSSVQLIQTLDYRPTPGGPYVGLISVRNARQPVVQQAVQAIRSASAAPGPSAGAQAATGNRLLAALFPQAGPGAAAEEEAEVPAAPPGPGPGAPAPEGAPAGPEAMAAGEEAGGLVGPVNISVIEELGIIIIEGRQADVEQVMDVLQRIQEYAEVTEPAIRVLGLQHVDCTALAEVVTQVYQEVFAPRQGPVTIVALVKPNALLLVGRPENVDTALGLARQLDKPVAPETRFQVFRLRYAVATEVADTITDFYEEREGLGPQVQVMADFRSNSLIVQGSPRDLAEVGQMIARLDTPDSQAVNEIRLFQLQNSPAEDVATVLQEAIQGAAPGAPGQQAQAGQKSVSLRFLKVDAEGKKLLSSGVLTDVQITADARSNAVLVSAPAESMPLIEALVREFDRLPAAEAQIKVFEIVNGDAEALVNMLQDLFGEPAGAGEMAVQTAAAEGESSLVPLRFSVDVRSNSIIASGTAANLALVEAILLRLDEAEVRERETKVFRLKNSPADAVSQAVNDYLQSERAVEQIAPGLVSPFEQIEREVVVVPELVSNSLIVSATPRYFQEIVDLVEQLDERPPMVMIQVLIAQVSLRNTDEFGVELGLQDSVLFDRSLLENLERVTTTIQEQTPGGATTSTTQETIVSADNTPGLNFNNQPLGNSGSSSALANAAIVGTQGLSSFAIGRTNGELGYGGLVLTASSESVSMLLRALQESRRLEILSRPQIMTLDNQPAFIQVGERVPRITNVQVTETGTVNNVTLDNVGLIMGVRPRISPDGLVVMELDAEKSELGPEAEGIPISISVTGDVIRSPRIESTTAQTTVAALSGQTIVLGGLITKSRTRINRRVPVLADIPILGELFRYDLEQGEKTELLIIMTPHIIKNEEDAETLKQVEMSRIHWCLSDAIEIHGDVGLRGRGDEWTDAETMVIYPDGLEGLGEVPTPAEPLEGPEVVPDQEVSPFQLEEVLPESESENGPEPSEESDGSPSAYRGPALAPGAGRAARR